MQEQKNKKLFAIVQNTSCHPALGYTVPHIFGVIFDIDRDGKATDFTAIDYDGQSIRQWERDNFGRAEKIYDHQVGAEKVIFFPITEDSAARMKAVMRELNSEQNAGRNPAYFGGVPPLINSELEARSAQVKATFIGPQRYAARLQYQRMFDTPTNETNCMKFLQDMLCKIGGVPLDKLCIDSITMPYTGDSRQMSSYMARLSGEQSEANRVPAQPSRMINCGNGLHAYAVNFAYRQPHGVGSITYELNSLKHTISDGQTMPLAKFLIEHSEPFYDPALNEHNLGRGIGTWQPQPTHSR